ncbi:hypothetical protein H9P43_005829 [Blastocladiella emersonii ATCC 22665]|nr:hypothetical protein H9P43_005829 [Blastocladiella emersonii ATCC 22665]
MARTLRRPMSLLQLLVAVVALTLALAAQEANAQCASVRVRKEVRDLSPAEIAGIQKAFNALMSKGKLASYVKMHQDNSEFAHNSPHFLVWHRQMLSMFEKDFVAETGGTPAALPYWASSLDAANPGASPVFSPNMFGSGAAGCLTTPFANFKKTDGSCVRRGLRNGAWMVEPVQAILARVSRASYSDFSSYIEMGGHAAAHNGVGGDMANLLQSPWDPLFWMHHNGVDKVFSNWQAQSAANADMYDGEHAGKPVSKNDDVMGAKAGFLLDHQANLCYRFAEPGAAASNTGRDAAGGSTFATGTATGTATPTATTSGATAAPTATPGIGAGGKIPQIAPFSEDFLKSFNFPADKLNSTMAAAKLATDFANRLAAEGKQLPSLNDLKNLNLGPLEALIASPSKSSSAGGSGAAASPTANAKSGAASVSAVLSAAQALVAVAVAFVVVA